MYFNVKLNRFPSLSDGWRESGAILLSGSSRCDS
jgi:hypothetical protein